MKPSTKKLLEAEVNKYVSNIKPKITDILEKSVLSLMGLEKNYHSGYDIDHCNGRNSVLIDAFRQIAIDEAKKIASTYKPSKEDILNFKSAFAKEYKSQFNYAVRDIIRARVNSDCEKLLSEIKLDVDTLVSETLNK